MIWLLVLGAINIFLLFFLSYFILPKKFLKPDEAIDIKQILSSNYISIIIIVGVVCFHIIEVKFIDPWTTNIISYDYANNLYDIEGKAIYWFSQNWNMALLSIFVIIYIAVYPFTLWFIPLYYLLENKQKPLKTVAYGLLIIYSIALPFYLFLPVTNDYTYFGTQSALETVIPTIERFFYSTTTHNNCLPSLHTAMTILIAYSASVSGIKKLKYFAVFIMISVIISVFYLSIHWLLDVFAGALLAIVTIFLLDRYILKLEKT